MVKKGSKIQILKWKEYVEKSPPVKFVSLNFVDETIYLFI